MSSSAFHLLSSVCKAKMMLVAGYSPSHELLRVVASQFVERWAEVPLFQSGCKLFPPDSHQALVCHTEG